MNRKFLVILLTLFFIAIGYTLFLTFRNSEQQPSDVNQIENVSRNIINTPSVITGEVLTSETGEQVYVEDTSGISFLIPEGWTVDSATFYETAAGHKAAIPTVILKRAKDEGEFLAYNLRQGCGRDINLDNKSNQELLSEIRSYYSESYAQWFCIEGVTLASLREESVWEAGIFIARSIKFNR